jgi:predicted Zn-dependent peptidase
VSALFGGCATDDPLRSTPPRSPGAALVEAMTFPPLQTHIPRLGREVERRVLPNGIVLYLASDRSLPTLDVTAVFRAGSHYEDPGRPGTALLTASQLRSGGTTVRSYAAMNEELEFLAVSIEASASTESLSVSMQALRKDADQAMSLLAEMLLRPAFDPTPLQTAQGRIVEDLRRVLENPGRLAAREFSRRTYTDAHPLGRPLTAAQASALHREDLADHYRRFVRPDNLLIAATGDFSLDELEAIIRAHLGGWQADHPLRLPPLPTVGTQTERAVYVLPRPLTQATVLLGHFGVTRANPDRYAIDLMDFILGGSGFTSRITDRLRTEEGLAYSAWASFPTSTRDVSLYRAGVQTKNENVPRAVRAILEEMERLQREPVTPAELERAKDATANSFVFRFPSRASAVLQLLMLEFDGEPPSFYETLLDRYRAVTIQDIQRVARQYLHPAATTVLVVGDAAKFESDLASFGPVHRIAPGP